MGGSQNGETKKHAPNEKTKHDWGEKANNRQSEIFKELINKLKGIKEENKKHSLQKTKNYKTKADQVKHT